MVSVYPVLFYPSPPSPLCSHSFLQSSGVSSFTLSLFHFSPCKAIQYRIFSPRFFRVSLSSSTTPPPCVLTFSLLQLLGSVRLHSHFSSLFQSFPVLSSLLPVQTLIFPCFVFLVSICPVLHFLPPSVLTLSLLQPLESVRLHSHCSCLRRVSLSSLSSFIPRRVAVTLFSSTPHPTPTPVYLHFYLQLSESSHFHPHCSGLRRVSLSALSY